MFFYFVNDDVISIDFFFDRLDNKFMIISAQTTFGITNKMPKETTFNFINNKLDIIKYQVTPKILRVAFFKEKYLELFEDKAKSKNGFIEFDFPYIINILKKNSIDLIIKFLLITNIGISYSTNIILKISLLIALFYFIIFLVILYILLALI